MRQLRRIVRQLRRVVRQLRRVVRQLRRIVRQLRHTESGDPADLTGAGRLPRLRACDKEQRDAEPASREVTRPGDPARRRAAGRLRVPLTLVQGAAYERTALVQALIVKIHRY